MPEGGKERVEDKVCSLQQKQRPTVVALHSVHYKILSPSVQRLSARELVYECPAKLSRPGSVTVQLW